MLEERFKVYLNPIVIEGGNYYSCILTDIISSWMGRNILFTDWLNFVDVNAPDKTVYGGIKTLSNRICQINLIDDYEEVGDCLETFRNCEVVKLKRIKSKEDNQKQIEAIVKLRAADHVNRYAIWTDEQLALAESTGAFYGVCDVNNLGILVPLKEPVKAVYECGYAAVKDRIDKNGFSDVDYDNGFLFFTEEGKRNHTEFVIEKTINSGYLCLYDFSFPSNVGSIFIPQIMDEVQEDTDKSSVKIEEKSCIPNSIDNQPNVNSHNLKLQTMNLMGD